MPSCSSSWNITRVGASGITAERASSPAALWSEWLMYPLPCQRRDGSGATITSGRRRRTSRVTFRRVSAFTSRNPSSSPRNVTVATSMNSASSGWANSTRAREKVITAGYRLAPRTRLYPAPELADTLIMPREHLHGTSIVWRFAITSFIVFALVGVGIAAMRSGDLRARSEDAAAVRAKLIAESVIAPLLTPSDLEGPIRGERYEHLDAVMREVLTPEAGVERIKIWSRDGTVLFSNDRDQVGLEPEPEEDLLEAFEGELASEISDLEEPENASERLLADE